jgi:hypothetical protein
VPFVPDDVPVEQPELTPPVDAQPAATESTTPSGYSYTVVDDSESEHVVTGAPTPRRRTVHPAVAAVAVVVAAVLTGVLVWLFAPSSNSGGTNGRLAADVASVLNAFSQGQSGAVTTRYEGELPPGFPGDLPLHAGAKLVSSIGQVQGADAVYLVIWDTGDARDSVADDYRKLLSTDPWQIDRTQDGRDSTLHQFSKIDDPQITGVVLVAESKDAKNTTILASVQVTSGGKNAAGPPFTAVPGRAPPDGFPDQISPYTGATLIESGYQKQSGATSYAVSYITKDDAAGVLDFYRNKLAAANLTVTDAAASQSAPADAAAIQFTDAQQSLQGGVTVGKFAEDATYTRIDVTVQVTKK